MNSRANEGFQGPGIQQVAEGTKDLEFGNLTWGALCACVHGCAYICACVYLCVHVCVCACVYVLVCVCVCKWRPEINVGWVSPSVCTSLFRGRVCLSDKIP